MNEKLEKMTLDELSSMAKNPRGKGLTLKDLMELTKLMTELQEIEAQTYKQLTWWGKVKSIFSKKPVYIKIKKGENK